MNQYKIYSLFFVFLFAQVGLAQIQVGDDGSTNGSHRRPAGEPIGKDTASQFMNTSSAANHYLGLHVGTYIDDKAYRWERSYINDAGKLTAGVTYRVGEWTNSMDMLFRGDFNTYNLGNEQSAVKLSLMPMVSFPDANSAFPLYFGGGIGLGVFFKQTDGESNISFDYQLVGGVRFLNVVESTGFFFETGIKNHIHLLSDGQFNGVFAAFGSVFTF